MHPSIIMTGLGCLDSGLPGVATAANSVLPPLTGGPDGCREAVCNGGDKVVTASELAKHAPLKPTRRARGIFFVFLIVKLY